MKTCPHCKISVGNSARRCPLCQSQLHGEDDSRYWPEAEASKLGRQSLFWKIISFVVYSTVLICLALDFILLPPGGPLHWSLPISVWLLALMFITKHFVNHHRNIPQMLFLIMIYASLLLGATAWYIDKWELCIDYIIPAICTLTLVANFVFSFIDASFTENSLVYMLCNIVVGVVPFISFQLYRGEAPLEWGICLLSSIITFVGLAIFKGRALWSEIEKRLHI